MTSPTAPVISPTGITAPTYAAVYQYLVTQYQSIFGADAYLGNDSQDGQLLAVFAQAISDANNATVAVYNAFSPTTAQGAGLSSVVAINGLTRLVPTSSTVNITLTGSGGTVITNGIVGDANGYSWALPVTTTIGTGGTVTVSASCTTVGAIYITASTAITIQTPAFGWSSAAIATPFTFVLGSSVETDAALRVRQAGSVALPSQTVFQGIVAAIENLSGTTRVLGVENNTGAPLGSPTVYPYGIPGNTLCFVVESTASQANIFNAIFEKITPGIPTYGVPIASFTGYITTVGLVGTLHIVSVTSGTIAIGHTIQYNGIANSVTISGGSGATWNLSGFPVAVGSVGSPVAMWSGTFVAKQVSDSNGSLRYLTYNPATEVNLNMTLTGVALAGYSSNTLSAIVSELTSYLANLPIGSNISYFGLIPYISLVGTPYFGTFEITGFTMALNPSGLVTSNGASFVTSGVTSGTSMTITGISGTVVNGQQIWYSGITQVITIASGAPTGPLALSVAPTVPIPNGTTIYAAAMGTADIPLNFNYAPNIGHVFINGALVNY